MFKLGSLGFMSLLIHIKKLVLWEKKYGFWNIHLRWRKKKVTQVHLCYTWINKVKKVCFLQQNFTGFLTWHTIVILQWGDEVFNIIISQRILFKTLLLRIRTFGMQYVKCWNIFHFSIIFPHVLRLDLL